MPELNTQLFQKIYDWITTHPELHDQSNFEEVSSCGTIRCIAGLAIFIDARDKGEAITRFRHSTDFQASGKSPSGFAQELLGLTDEEAELLFFQVSNEGAVRNVKAAAQGVRPPFDEEDW